MALFIARAGLEAATEADALIREAAGWLILAGEPLWGPEETSYDELQHVAEAGELVVGRVGEDIAACMFLHDKDPQFWPEDPPGAALYVHRLVVARLFKGRGFAHAMLRWAEDETRTRGRNFLRLDCVPRPKLLTLYRQAGFVPVDPRPIQVGRHFVVRHEKPVRADTA